MPLYMDIHTVDSDTFSVEDVVKAHMEDLAIQEQFGVTQLKYWVNVEAKTLFCLMKGPDKEACNEVHRKSHGNTACNIIEVSDDEFNLFLGVGNNINDLAKTISGEIDSGYRTILLVRIFNFTGKHNLDHIYTIIKKHEGSIIVHPDDEIMVSFIFASQAILCAVAIEHLVASLPDNIELTLAIASGRPVDEKGENLFEETRSKVHCLSALGSINRIYIDSDTKALSEKETISSQIHMTNFDVVQNDDFEFLNRLFQILNENSHTPEFKSNYLYGLLGLSKSQAYRKISLLTGMPPNQLLQELRLRKSLVRIQRKSETIAEIAYDMGFNSPTYFTRAFKKRFGLLPTSFAKQQL